MNMNGNESSEPKERMDACPAHIAERIFRESPYGAFRYLKCSFSEGELRITGQVPTFHLKQLAQTVVRSLDGVAQIRNEIEVPE